MDELTSIFFYMNSRNANALGFTIYVDINMTAQGDRLIELGNLVGFGKIWIVIVFPVKLAVVLDITIDSQGKPQGKFNHLLVHDRQGARHTKADRADMGVRFAAKGSGAGAESFGLRL